MGLLADFRSKNPEYNDWSDEDLSNALYDKYYTDMPREEYDAQTGYISKMTQASQKAESASGETEQPASPVKNVAASSVGRAAGRVGAAAGRGVKEALRRDDPAGFDDPLVADYKGDSLDYVRSLANAIANAPAAVVDTALRLAYAPIKGAAAGAGQIAREMGSSQGDASRLERDLLMMADSEGFRSAGRARRVDPAKETQGPQLPVRNFADEVIEGSQNPREAVLSRAEELGVTVPKAAATNSPSIRSVAGALQEIPVIGAPIRKAITQGVDKLSQTVKGVTESLGSGSAKAAGDDLRDDMVNWQKVVSRDEASAIYKPVEALTRNKTGQLARTSLALVRIEREARALGLTPPAVFAAYKGVMNKELTFDQMQTLRTNLGDRLSGKIAAEPGMSQTAVRLLYRELSSDIKQLIKNSAGQKGLDAWTEANAKFRNDIRTKRDTLSKIIGAAGDATPESVVTRLKSMASVKKGADIDRLEQAAKTVSPEAWGEFGSALVADMGATKDGFSIAKFRTEMSKLSTRGKKAIFSPEHLRALESVDIVGSRFEALQKLGNPSGSARVGAIITATTMALHNPLMLIESAIGGTALSYMLSRPATAKAAASWSHAYLDAAKEMTEANYNTLKLASQDLRRQMDAFGIKPEPATLGVGAAANANSPTDYSQFDEALLAGDEAEQSAPEAPPIEGAMRAPDGQWYLPDKARPGKYLRVVPQ